MNPVEFTRRAIDSIDRIRDFIGQESSRAADRFLDQVTAARHLPSEQPLSGRTTKRPDTRVLSLSTHPYKVFYRVSSDGDVLILDVRHARRRPLAFE